MKQNKLLTALMITILSLLCLLALCGCAKKTTTEQQPTPQTCTTEYPVAFGKKYYALSANGCDKLQYYQFNKDGTAIYNVTIKDSDNNDTFKSTINFKWFYEGNGQFILLHNGTRVTLGKQDTATGFGRVMHTSKCAIYWENMYYISEDCVNAIPNYAKMLTSGRTLPRLPH